MIGLFRFLLRGTTTLYLLALLTLMAVLHWRGESAWYLGLLLYLPAPVLLTPMLLLLPACLLFGAWRALLAQLACAALLCFGYMTYGFSPGGETGRPDLTLLTWNIGESNEEEVAAFLQAQKPDVVLMQDALGRGAEWMRAHPEWHLASEGQFICLSRFPILGVKPLLAEPAGFPVAARFVLRIKGHPAAFYSVHLPTPRPELRPFLTRHPLAGTAAWRAYIAEHEQLARELATLIAAEKEPLLVAGDFNNSDHGAAYHRFPPLLTDVFAKAGRGYGFTFPGDTRNPVTRGPWLRLDYLWSGPAWHPLSCETSAGRLSQHRAVVARFAQK